VVRSVEGEVKSALTGEDGRPERQRWPARGNSYSLVLVWWLCGGWRQVLEKSL